MKQVIHIFGASGSGTSTLGRTVSESMGLAFMDTDDYYWLPAQQPYTHKRPAGERLELIRKDVAQSGGAVLSGSLVDWGDPLIPLFTLAVRVVTPTPVRLRRIELREYQRFGARILPGGDRHDAFLAFLSWCAQYDDGGMDTRSRRKHDAWQQMLSCGLITLDGTRPPQENADIVRRRIERGI